MTNANPKRVTSALLLMAGVLVLAGCFGPLQRPTVSFAVCPYGGDGRLDYWFEPITSTIPGAAIVDVEWDFGDGTDPVHAGPWDILHRFQEPGTYRVAATTTDSRGVSGTATREITVALAVFVHSDWTLTLGYPPTVRGVIENRSMQRLRTVVVRAKFYDADTVRVSDDRVEILDLDPGEMAAFEIRAENQPARVFYASVEIASFDAECGTTEPAPADGRPETL